jgi:GT2 family glycosyltransferase
MCAALTRSSLVERVLVAQGAEPDLSAIAGYECIPGSVFATETLDLVLDGIATEYLLLLTGGRKLSLDASALETMLEAAASAGTGMVYSDFYEEDGHGKDYHPLNDYQTGSVRDTFDFGPLRLFSVSAIRKGRKAYSPSAPVRFAGLYDLRLRVSIDHLIRHVAEPLYVVSTAGEASADAAIFAYVDPKNALVEKEMEAVFTGYLRGIRAYLPSRHLKAWDRPSASFPVEASVIIPVRNRKGKIEEAIMSALSQETDFSFNVLVVDNHSTDGTTAVLSDLARQHARLRHIVPLKTDLGIGGCWNEALYNPSCGRYAVQLDSDDLYITTRTLQRIVDMLRKDGFAMVIGAYTLVDQDLKRIGPGLIDHREWSDENGHNNALRVNGLGAPRAFNTELMREIGFRNISYGEDYAAALRICREYRIGRIYDSLYLCRRWSGNTDAALTIEETNRNNAFKDRIRTDEILARQELIRERGELP